MTALGIAMVCVPATAQTLRCEVQSKQECQPTSGCNPAAMAVFNKIDLDRQTFSRCDSMGCDDYQATFTASGIFMNIDVVGRGLSAKLNTSDNSFLETASMGDIVYVSFGKCRAMP
jgi:hypothetical protein